MAPFISSGKVAVVVNRTMVMNLSKSVRQMILLLTVGRRAQEFLSDQIQNSFR